MEESDAGVRSDGAGCGLDLDFLRIYHFASKDGFEYVRKE